MGSSPTIQEILIPGPSPKVSLPGSVAETVQLGVLNLGTSGVFYFQLESVFCPESQDYR